MMLRQRPMKDWRKKASKGCTARKLGRSKLEESWGSAWFAIALWSRMNLYHQEYFSRGFSYYVGAIHKNIGKIFLFLTSPTFILIVLIYLIPPKTSLLKQDLTERFFGRFFSMILFVGKFWPIMDSSPPLHCWCLLLMAHNDM